jgi:hypothetical protein
MVGTARPSYSDRWPIAFSGARRPASTSSTSWMTIQMSPKTSTRQSPALPALGYILSTARPASCWARTTSKRAAPPRSEPGFVPAYPQHIHRLRSENLLDPTAPCCAQIHRSPPIMPIIEPAQGFGRQKYYETWGHSAKASPQETPLRQVRGKDAVFMHRGRKAWLRASRLRMHEMPQHAEFCHAGLTTFSRRPVPRKKPPLMPTAAALAQHS